MPFPVFVLVSSLIAAATAGATLLLRRRPGLAAPAALVGTAGLLIFHGPGFFRLFPVDDAFILFRYSKNLANGLGPNWNSEGHVEGYTSFLWMAVLAGMDKAGIDIVAGARALAWASILGTLVIVWRIWKLWADEHPGSGLDSPAVLAIALLGLGLADGVSFWGFSGMETPLFMLLLAFAAYLYLAEQRGSAVPWSALAFVAVALTRPEGAIAAGVTGAFVVAEVAYAEDRPRAIARAAAWGALFVGLYGSYFLWRYSYYDYLFPNTFYAKAGPTTAVLNRGVDYILAALLNYQLLAMFGGLALLTLLPRLRRDAAYIGALTLALLGAVAIEGGDSFGHGRFIAPLLPLMYLSGVAGFAVLLRRLPFDVRQSGVAAGVFLAVAGLMLLRGSNNPYLPEERYNAEDRRMLGEWLSERTPPDYTIAAFAIGTLGYYSDRDMLDLLGLNDVTIGHTDIPNFGSGIAGHEKFNPTYVYEEVRPEIIITGDSSPGPQTLEELQRLLSIAALPAKAAYFIDPRAWELYDVRSVMIEGRWFNFLQRRDTIAELEATGLQ